MQHKTKQDYPNGTFYFLHIQKKSLHLQDVPRHPSHHHMSACMLQGHKKTNHIGLYINVRIGYRISYSCLCCQINNNSRMIFFSNISFINFLSAIEPSTNSHSHEICSVSFSIIPNGYLFSSGS